MAQLPQLNSIARQKSLLQAQCTVCRQSLELQLAALRVETDWLRRGADSISHYRSYLWLAAPVFAFFVARRGRVLRGLLLRGLASWQLLSRLWQWTRFLRQPR